MGGICWLASYPKSGNTWLRAFLANLFSGPCLPDRPIPINALNRYSLADDFIADYARLAGRPGEDLSDHDLSTLRPQVHARFAAASDQTVFVKTHNAAIAIDGVPLITPSVTAGAVYVVRNPFDVAVSYAHHFQVPIEQAVTHLNTAHHTLPPSDGLMRRYLGSWSEHVRTWTGAPGLRLHVVRYEDLKGDPHTAFGSIVHFLGLPDERERLRRAIAFSSFEGLRAQEEEDGFQESRPDGRARFFRSGTPGEWRTALSTAQIDAIRGTHLSALIEFGYAAPDGSILV